MTTSIGVSANDLVRRIESGDPPVILDVRSGLEFARGHVPGARHVPFWNVAGHIARIPAQPDDEIVVYCGHGPRAQWAAAALRRRGFGRVRLLDGHWTKWARARFRQEAGPARGTTGVLPAFLIASFSIATAAGSAPGQPASSQAGIVPRLVQAAIAQTTRPGRYDGSYRRIGYPGGDVPADIGVCTDVIIRAYRAVNIDLQVSVHEDMTRAFSAYPQIWRATGPDANIDHRRVPNLQTFFRRHGTALARSSNPADYAPGDLVTWLLPGNLPHIGIVADGRSADGRRPLIVHNIGRGPELSDSLFQFTITGHYRYRGEQR